VRGNVQAVRRVRRASQSANIVQGFLTAYGETGRAFVLVRLSERTRKDFLPLRAFLYSSVECSVFGHFLQTSAGAHDEAGKADHRLGDE
jgi:hypothetical protein